MKNVKTKNSTLTARSYIDNPFNLNKSSASGFTHKNISSSPKNNQNPNLKIKLPNIHHVKSKSQSLMRLV
jgi:hypothetical protein